MSRPVIVGETIHMLSATDLQARSAVDGSVLWAWKKPTANFDPVGHSDREPLGLTFAIDLNNRQQV